MPTHFTYIPTKTEEKARKIVYDDIDEMISVRNKTYPEFNGPEGDRTLTQYIDDGDRRVNGNTPSREAQGKEDWQENLFNPVTRQKLRAIVAGVALSPPEFSYKASNRQGMLSVERAEMAKQLVRHSQLLGNPRIEMFWDVWEAAAKGTVIKYDCYKYREDKVKVVTGYDPTTGKVTYETSEHVVEDRLADEPVPINELFIWDIYIPNIQDQPKLAWIEYYDKTRLKTEFKKYANYKYVKDSGSLSKISTNTDTYFHKAWGHRSEKNGGMYEVVRYYSKAEDKYEIWVNGVPLLRAPLLWGKYKKLYPFSKSIHEPFANRKFFYGKHLPSVLQGWQDVNNSMWNSVLDQMYRSLNPAMLVGLVNKDLLDVEDEIVTQDTKIYVPDINQVKPMPTRGVQGGDIQLLQMVARGMDLISVDPSQQGSTGRGVTAREIMIADERASEMKGIFYIFIEDLCLQKTRLRVLSIMTHYMQQKVEKILGKDGAVKFSKLKTVYNVPDVPFSDGTTGVLGVQVVENKKDLPSVTDIEAVEEAMEEKGINYKLVAVPFDYLDDWELDFTIIPESLENKSMAKQLALIQEKQQMMATLYPEYLASNKEKAFAEFIGVYGEGLDEYAPPAPSQSPEGGTLSPLDEMASMEGPLAEVKPQA
jgi:hypothetical protein